MKIGLSIDITLDISYYRRFSKSFGVEYYSLRNRSLMYNILLMACDILTAILTGGLRVWRLIQYYRIHDIIIISYK